MNRLFISTRGFGSWRERLAKPDEQWKRGCSAFEIAVSWELAASKTKSGLPEPIAKLFRDSDHGDPDLLFAVAEHKVDLEGKGHASQSDVWAIVETKKMGKVSVTVEAKAKEPFGGETLKGFLEPKPRTQESDNEYRRRRENRRRRFEYISSRLPHPPSSDSFMPVRYQLLHRCAASVIEAKRLGFQHAAFVVQAFEAPTTSFDDYSVFCRAIKVEPRHDSLVMAAEAVHDISLSFGWVDCALATDKEVAKVAER
jgi:hypothetical protein